MFVFAGGRKLSTQSDRWASRFFFIFFLLKSSNDENVGILNHKNEENINLLKLKWKRNNLFVQHKKKVFSQKFSRKPRDSRKNSQNITHFSFLTFAAGGQCFTCKQLSRTIPSRRITFVHKHAKAGRENRRRVKIRTFPNFAENKSGTSSREKSCPCGRRNAAAAQNPSGARKMLHKH